MVSGLYWSSGKRAHNEDSLALESVHVGGKRVTFLVVADGIGSLSRGEDASGYVVESFVRWFYNQGIYMIGRSHRRIRRSLNKCAFDCCHRMRSFARNQKITWGTTCALVVVWQKKYAAFSIGDSFIGIVKNKRMTPLFEQDRDSLGRLTKAMGSMTYEAAGIRFGRLRCGEGILVATDGFVEKLSVEELGQALTFEGELSDERVNLRLFQLGGEIDRRGGIDNRSAVYICI